MSFPTTVACMTMIRGLMMEMFINLLLQAGSHSQLQYSSQTAACRTKATILGQTLLATYSGWQRMPFLGGTSFQKAA